MHTLYKLSPAWLYATMRPGFPVRKPAVDIPLPDFGDGQSSKDDERAKRNLFSRSQIGI